MEEKPRETLLQFEPPQEVAGDIAPPRKRGGMSNRRKGSLPALDAKPSIEDILHAVLPPREWLETGRKYVQYVSAQMPSRNDVDKLKQQLDQKLMERQARDSGICPVREELYSQGFDELIRHITLDCPERGLLLMRVRDEIRMTIAAYQTLYNSSVTFGVRKQLQSEQGKAEMEEAKSELEERKIRLENRKAELLNKKEALLCRFKEKRQVDQAKRTTEIEFLDYQGKHLENFLSTLEIKS